ncbi:MAG: hypothetical protein PHD13_06890 [Methanocellales archaeon]|nr:hypothetical protein [Methanocellales archaeon]MDD3291989.1 hypothetical protein [Methanocellales archaeon]MDD5235885.1 hypothetical protein [Methanocellales archaeon]MDD5485456.1 hypothetical protein [Methanocellales archaeon]
MKYKKEQNFWGIVDETKRRLLSRLRIETSLIDYLNYDEYRMKFESIPDSLIEEWAILKEEYKDTPAADFNRIKGFLYEALFYYACMKAQTVFLDAELCEFGGAKFEEPPPWFECIPLYDIIPNLHYIWEKNEKKRKAPQTKVDFLVIYVYDKGPLPPALIEVKSSKELIKYNREELNWQIIAAMRLGFIFQVAYPDPNIKSTYPRSLREWEIKTPCSRCEGLSDDFRKCSKCGEDIFPFTIVDTHYTLRELIGRLGKNYNVRF